MDKSLCLVAVVAFSCTALPNASAQIQLHSGLNRPVLVVNQSADDPSPEINTNETEIANPFDFFNSLESPQEAQSLSLSHGEQSAAPTESATPAKAARSERSPSDDDAAALPVAKQQRSVVETIVDQSLIASVPHVAHASIQWTGTCQTPNPIADLLLREDCNSRALWAGYELQRAAECHHMWAHIAKHQQRGCHQGCGQAGCGPTDCNGGGHKKIRNRYLTEAPVACDTGCVPTTFAAPAVPTHHVPGFTPALQLPHQSFPPVPTPAPHIAPTSNAAQSSDINTHAEPSKVAFFPMFQR